LDAKIVSGYPGGNDMCLAAGRGEVDSAPGPAALGLDGMKKGFVKPPVAIMGRKRVAAFPDSPAVSELVKFTPEQETLFKLADATSCVFRAGATRPGVPEDRVKFMQDAFAKIVAMKAFEEQSKSFFPLGPTPMSGKELNAYMKEALSMTFDPIKAMINKYLIVK
jgi:tripartite-type tricarboxylate transporter receptor subunit TctC